MFNKEHVTINKKIIIVKSTQPLVIKSIVKFSSYSNINSKKMMPIIPDMKNNIPTTKVRATGLSFLQYFLIIIILQA